MANLTFVELVQPQHIVATISKIRVGRGALSKFFNFDIGNGKIAQVPVDQFAARIFNETRQPATFRLAGSGPAIITPNPAGEERFYLTKMYEKMVFPATMMGNISKIDGPNAEQDKGGVQYLERQMQYIGRRFNMGTELLTAAFVRGSLFLQVQGDQLIPYLTNPGSGQVITVTFKLPSTNINQLSMGTGTPIIDISWDDPSANIVNHILGVQAAMVSQSGMALSHLIVNSVTWGYIINNISVRTVGGIMDSPFPQDSWTMTTAKDENGNEMYGAMEARLRAVPWLKILIINDVLSIGGDLDPINNDLGQGSSGANNVGTLTKVIPDGVALFTPTPDTSWCQMVHGGEWVAENEGVSNWVWKQGLQSWKRFNAEPTSINIVSMLKSIPVPFLNPWGYATVKFSGAPS